MELSIVIPVRNEAANIAPLVAEIRAALDGVLDYEIVYVDDGSERRHRRRDPRARRGHSRACACCATRKSCGQSAAVRSGVKAARAPWIATLDGDGQNDPADIPRLWQMARAAPPMPPLLVAGHRQAPPGQRGEARLLAHRQPRCARGCCTTTRPTPAAASSCSAATCFSTCRSSTTCTASCRRWCCARAGASSRCRSIIGRASAANRITARFDRLWVGIVDLLGVMWLQRRAKRPEILAESAEEARRAG